MWELWTGREPYEGLNYHALLHQITSSTKCIRPAIPGNPDWEGEHLPELAPGWRYVTLMSILITLCVCSSLNTRTHGTGNMLLLGLCSICITPGVSFMRIHSFPLDHPPQGYSPLYPAHVSLSCLGDWREVVTSAWQHFAPGSRCISALNQVNSVR
jgi:hypothetical protein